MAARHDDCGLGDGDADDAHVAFIVLISLFVHLEAEDLLKHEHILADDHPLLDAFEREEM